MSNDSLLKCWGTPQLAAWRRTYPQEARLLKQLLRERLTRAAERSPGVRDETPAIRRSVMITSLAWGPSSQRDLVVH